MLRRSGADSSEVGDYDEGCAAIAGAVRGTRNGEGGRVNFAFQFLTKKVASGLETLDLTGLNVRLEGACLALNVRLNGYGSCANVRL
jgi:hypothetical protein